MSERASECRRALLAVAMTLAGLWAILDLPQTGAILLPFSVLNAELTAVTLAWIGVPVVREVTVLSHAGGFACEVHYTCTAFVPLMLLAAGILAGRVSRRRRALGVACGAILILLLNQVRLTTLMWVGIHAPAEFDVIDSWLWPVALSGVMVIYWWVWRWGLPSSATPVQRPLKRQRLSPVM